MKHRYFVPFFLFLMLTLLIPSISFYIFFAHASPENQNLLNIDNQRKAAHPNELVQFNATITNNKNNTETFIIRHAWENSSLWFPLDTTMGDDNQEVYDSSPFGNHGTLKNFNFNENSGWVSQGSRTVLKFDGKDDYVEVARNASLEPSHDMTILAWILLNDTSGWKPIVNHAYANGYSFDVSGDQIYLALRQATGYTGAYVSAGLVAGNWTQVAMVLESDNEVKVYKNAEEQVFAYGSHGTGNIVYSDTNLTIGSGHIIKDSYFGGFIGEVCILNRALTPEEINWLYNDRWSENMSRYTVALSSGENAQAIFSVIVPEGVKAGYIQKFLLTTFPKSTPKYTETKIVTVETLEYRDVAVSLDENEKSGKPGSILTFEVTVKNLGNLNDTYDITVEGGEKWSLFLSAESLILSPGAVGPVTVSVTVPFEACPGDSVSFKVQAASRGDPSLVRQVKGVAIATAIYNFSITAPPELRQGSPGSEVTFSLELRNFGTAPDTFYLKVENALSWDVEVDPSNISLENGRTGQVAVRVRIPEDAFIGQLNRIIIHAVSRGDPNILAESSISVKVVTPFWERPDVTFLFGLLIGAFVGATLIGSIILRRAPDNLWKKLEGLNVSNSIFR